MEVHVERDLSYTCYANILLIIPSSPALRDET